jgi:hypothetical protein
MIRKLRSGKYRLYSRKVDPQTGRRRNLGHLLDASRSPTARARRAVLQAAELSQLFLGAMPQLFLGVNVGP